MMIELFVIALIDGNHNFESMQVDLGAQALTNPRY
jgi:hypothetical protein